MPWTRSDLDMRSLIADRTAERLTKGDPTLGWSGDPYLVLTFDNMRLCWEVFRDVGGHVTLVARKYGELDPDKLIRHLVELDTQTRNHKDVVDGIIAANEAVQAELRRRSEEALQEAQTHFNWAAKKDGLM